MQFKKRSGIAAGIVTCIVSAAGAHAGTFENQLIGLDDVQAQWATLDGVNDTTGQAQRVAVIDTGLDISQSGFLNALGGSRIVAGVNYASDATYGSTLATDYTDRNGHGTMVGGIIGSSSSAAPGVASGAELVSVRVADQSGNASLSTLNQGLLWVVDHAAAMNITTVNISLGTGWTYVSDGSVPSLGEIGQIRSSLATLESMNVVISAAAGNNASTTGMILPAIMPEDISVSGSTDSDTAVVSNANRNAALDLLAPGQSVGSLAMGGGTTGGTGTSFASPFVAGASVLVREEYLKFTDDLAGGFDSFQDRVLDLLQRTGHPITDATTGLTFKRIDLAAAITEIDHEFTPAGPITLLGDFTGSIAGLPDGVIDAQDINYLYSQISTDHPDLAADLNGDGLLTKADMDQLIYGTLKTMYGDVNLDGKVDTIDLVSWRNSFKGYGSGSGWESGDFNGDGIVDTIDLVLWRNAFKGYGIPPAWQASSAPEPAAAALMMVIAGALCVLRPQSRRCAVRI